ncbi:MAG: iron-sulfur cluster repair di-iron protein [Bacteroidetes bacterium]|jgi:regulator of cell morphogenesis and NO signaling|nr:iron-sulfur cluster repair di-iron protein [Bacteroidota bacterium]
MNQIESLEEERIGDIVAENFHAAGIFREYGIDFCCGGGESLADVCTKRGIQLQPVIDKLQTLFGAFQQEDANYNDWSPSFLIDYIINTHHKFVRKKTDEISAYAKKVSEVHGERYPENVSIYKMFVELSHELIEHLEAEEQRVFPLIKRIERDINDGTNPTQEDLESLRFELENMIEDHEGAGNTMAGIRTLSNEFQTPEGACATYRILYQNLKGFEEDLHKHVHLENNILFRKAENFLANDA